MAISKIPNAGISNAVNFRNLIINGDMSISQRGTSFATMGNGDTQYTLDRFQWNEEGSFGDAELTITQDTDVPTGQGFAKSLKAVCTTVDTSIDSNTISYITQKFEGQNLQHLNRGRSTAESLTLSFWAKSNLTGTFTVAFKDVDNTRLYSASYSPSVADTWEKFIITIPGDTSGGLSNDNGHSFSVDWNLQAGTNKSNGALTTAWEAQAEGDRAVGQTNFFSSTSNNFYLTGVQLEVGTTASDFEFLPHDVNLQRCQRYFYKLIDVPGGDSGGYFTSGFMYSGAILYSWNEFPTMMRAAPTLSVASGTDYYIFYRNSAADNLDNFDLTIGRPNGAMIRNNADVSGSGGQAGGIHSTSNSKVTFSSEL